MPDVKYPDVKVQLTGTDGNAMVVMSAVSRVLRREVGADVASSFVREALDCGSYDELLRLVQCTVDVS